MTARGCGDCPITNLKTALYLVDYEVEYSAVCTIAARLVRAEGIGLCRTEHMFFDDERIPKIRRMILADNEEERREALAGHCP